MKTRLQTPTTTRKMRKRAFRTRNEIYFRVLGPASAIEEKLSFVTRIYEAQNPEHWRGCTIVGFPRCMARDAMRDLRAARAVVLLIGHRSRYIAPRQRDDQFTAMEPGEVGDILTVDDLGHPGWRSS